MKIVELDLTGCKYWDELHERIRVAFDFSEYYGHNWSAFWDLLWSECDADEVIIKGEKTMSHNFDDALKKLHKILERNIEFRKKHNWEPFSYKIID